MHLASDLASGLWGARDRINIRCEDLPARCRSAHRACRIRKLRRRGMQPRHPRSGRSRWIGQKTILINSTAIMLAIIIPTMIATLAFAWWFRRGNAKATYRRIGNIRERSSSSCGASPS